MANTLEYKGYHGTVDYSSDDRVFYGKIHSINDLVSYEGVNVDEIEANFKEAVDDYLVTCKELNKTPDKEYKGLFNVRVAPELHKKISLYGLRNDMTLNNVVADALRFYIEFHQTGYRKFLDIGYSDATKSIRLTSTQYGVNDALGIMGQLGSTFYNPVDINNKDIPKVGAPQVTYLI